jgi:aspartyl-tRNA(Asn)/glutamyl-tRNA(Gln) amidotransferase subunit B
MIDSIKASMPRLPHAWIEYLTQEIGLSAYDANLLFDQEGLLEFFMEAKQYQKQATPKALVNWLVSDILGYCNKANIEFAGLKLVPQDLAMLTERLADGTLSSRTAKDLVGHLLQQEQGVDRLIDTYNLKQVSDTGLIKSIVAQVLEQYPSQREDLKSGKDRLKGFFVGQIMKASQGKANPADIEKFLTELL